MRIIQATGLALALASAGAWRVDITAAGASCESLATLALPAATITSAQAVPAGTFEPPAPAGRGGAAAPRNQVFARLGSFCRVTATLKPSADSAVKVEVWLPSSGWNGKFQAVGNGGWAGVIPYPALAAAVAAGYAAAGTDTGHEGNSAAFAVGHPEKVIDIAYRAVHEMAVHGKAITAALYGNAPRLSMWNGCSTGGRQGINAVAKYPADFDAVIAGAPALRWMTLHSARMTINATANRAAGSNIPAEKYAAIHRAVLNACDALDGATDGVIENPKACRFDPGVLACKGADAPTCLTSAQVDTARTLYSPVKHPKTGATVFPELLQPGTELNWNTLAGREPIGNAVEAFKYVVFQDAEWDPRAFDAATDIDRAAQIDRGLLDFTEPNLKPFFDRGGKLLMYHGWADPQVAPMISVNYYSDVLRTVGATAAGSSIQLYMVPGMLHCQGGPGTDTFNKVSAMEEWLSTGRAPTSIVASHMTAGKADKTRPLCPYPQVARYKGAGSLDEAANFACAAP